jgi:hypothetical protein
MKINGKDDIPYIKENKKCLKPPTSDAWYIPLICYCILFHFTIFIPLYSILFHYMPLYSIIFHCIPWYPHILIVKNTRVIERHVFRICNGDIWSFSSFTGGSTVIKIPNLPNLSAHLFSVQDAQFEAIEAGSSQAPCAESGCFHNNVGPPR